MTAEPHPNQQVLTRLTALEEKVKTEFGLLRANVEEYRPLCENRHLHTLVLNKEQRIAELEQQLEKCHNVNRDLKEKFMYLEKRYEETKGQMVTGDIASKSNIETQVTVTNTGTTQNDAIGVRELFKFAIDGNLAEVKSIVASGVDVNVVNRIGNPLLYYTAWFGRVAVCEHLLDKGANVNVKGGEDCATPLHMACSAGCIDVVKLLIARGASVAITDVMKYTPLHTASEVGDTRICEYLLDKGADVHVKGYEGRTPLHMACFKGHADVVKLLITRGASVTKTDSYKSTPLHAASEEGHTGICEYLLDNGADANFKNFQGFTPLHIACFKGHVDVVKLFIARGACVAITDSYKSTPLHRASENGHTGICEYLLDNGADVNDRDVQGLTSLHMACFKGHFDVVKLLIVRGACVSAMDNFGRTPLAWADTAGHTSVCEYLKG